MFLQSMSIYWHLNFILYWLTFLAEDLRPFDTNIEPTGKSVNQSDNESDKKE